MQSPDDTLTISSSPYGNGQMIPEPAVTGKPISLTNGPAVVNVGADDQAESNVVSDAWSPGSSACPSTLVVLVPRAVDLASANTGAVLGAPDTKIPISRMRARVPAAVLICHITVLAVFTPLTFTPTL
jgi:hypothetical protein